MFFRYSFIRLLAIPVCLVWGLVEFIALQRAHGVQRKLGEETSRLRLR